MSLPMSTIISGGLPLGGNGTIKPSTILDCADIVGTAGQVLSSTGTALEWITPAAGGSAATPSVLGTVYGCTTAAHPTSGTGDVALGLDAYCSVTTGFSNTAIGGSALGGLTSGCNNIAIGDQAGFAITSESNNVVIGANSALNGGMSSSVVLGASIDGNFAGDENVIAGFSAISNGSSGTAVSCSVILGGCALTAANQVGSNLVGIGHKIAMPNSSAGTQLAIGNCSTYWLTGNSDYAIKPGKGIIDLANSCGTAGQFLTSSGFNSLQWKSAPIFQSTSSSTTFGSGSGLTGSLVNNFGPGLNSWNYLGQIYFTMRARDTVTNTIYFYLYNGVMFANGSNPFNQTELASTLLNQLGGLLTVTFDYDTAYEFKPRYTITFVSGNPLETEIKLSWINLSGDYI